MKFYDRENELKTLSRMNIQSKESAKMTVLYGRRRIGKTSLALRATAKMDSVYLFVSKKSEKLLCQDFVEEIGRSLNEQVFGEISRFKDVFSWLMKLSETRPFTLILDEFQEFLFVNDSVFSEMQEVWDRKKDKSQMHLIISGSVYRLMKKIFEDAKEPLFGRADERIELPAFDVDTLAEIMDDNTESYKNIDLLTVYAVTGGIPKYVELLVDKKALNFERIVDELFRPNSFWLDEGKNLLINEFGREYTTYFSILSLIAAGKTSRTEIESILERGVGGFLDKLIKDFNLVKVVKPIFAKPQGKVQKYEISDAFLKLWFRFIFKYKSAIEANNFEYLKLIFERDFSVYYGKVLEKWIMHKFMATGRYTALGNYFERGGNEIDIVAVDELNKEIVFVEVKLNKKNLKLAPLKAKSEKVLTKFSGFKARYQLLSIEDMRV